MKLRQLAAPIALASALFFSGFHLVAQPQAPASQAEPAAGEGTHSAAPSEEPAHGEAPGHGSEAGAHHGPAITLFGLPLGQLGQFSVRVVNFAIFFAILYFILKGALSSAFKSRAKELEEQLNQAEKDKAEGEAQLRELETRMTGMQAQLEGILSESAVEAEAEKQRILAAARAEAAQILAQTRADIDYQKRTAEKELRALVAELAVEGAAKRLASQVQGATAERVLDHAIQEVGGAK
jgi:F-type H+-transporting ATPase subunit b